MVILCVCVCCRTADEVIPVKDSHMYATARPSMTVKRYEGANHCFTEPSHAAALVGDVCATLRGWVKRDKAKL